MLQTDVSIPQPRLMTAVTSVMDHESEEAAMTHLDTDAQVTTGWRLRRTLSSGPDDTAAAGRVRALTPPAQ